MPDFSVLIVGGGSIGERHLRTFQQTGEVAASICEPREKKLRELRQKYSVAKAYADFDDAPLSEFDAAVICTPPHLHIPMAIKAAEAGCHLLVEKPLSHSMDGVDDLIALAREKNLTTGVAFVLRHTPLYTRMKEKLDSGIIGQVRLACIKSGQQFSKYRPDYRNTYFARKSMGGGSILDAVSHLLNYLEWCLGREHEVCCMYDHLSEMEIETEDCAFLTLRFEGNVIAQIEQNLFQKDYQLYLEFVGSEGTLRLGGTLQQGAARPQIGFCRSDDEGWEIEPIPEYERDDTFTAQAQNFLNAIRGEEQIRTTLEEGRRTLKVCLKAKESYETKRILSI
ncbi:MAG: Gfo/Idh/MocA family oxidoreductase [Planctomycetes bacterium]|nr:Gfo/Idh/MocA family oxidoreductase [Planctomycetota bacterium]